jgi:hypothetical protein
MRKVVRSRMVNCLSFEEAAAAAMAGSTVVVVIVVPCTARDSGAVLSLRLPLREDVGFGDVETKTKYLDRLLAVPLR